MAPVEYPDHVKYVFDSVETLAFIALGQCLSDRLSRVDTLRGQSQLHGTFCRAREDTLNVLIFKK